MISKKEKKIAFENSRVASYFVIFLAGILQCKLPFTYVCDREEFSCLFCGMRQAIDYILNFNFFSAYKSNRLIVVIILIACFMIIDTIIIVFKRIKSKYNRH